MDEDGNILGEFIQEPLDLDLWATRPSQLQQLQQGQGQGQGQEQKGGGGGKRQSAAGATATGKRGGGGEMVSVFASPAALPGLPRSSSGHATAPDTAEEQAEAAGDDAHYWDRRIRDGEVPEGRERAREYVLSASPYDGVLTHRSGFNPPRDRRRGVNGEADVGSATVRGRG